MLIEQFEDPGLAHYSYAVLSEGLIALIDPGRDPRPYYEFAAARQARIAAILETHSHADFVSSHLEISEKTGAPVYVSEFMNAAFAHTPLKEGDRLPLGAVSLEVLYTPGHSFDSVCLLLKDPARKAHALFSGDTLFIGDVGRPDLREKVKDQSARREELARAMFHTLRDKLYALPDETLLYPAHGAGTLCGKGLSKARSSTMGAEKMSNYAFGIKDEDEFIRTLLADQPFVPRYFTYDVGLNRLGAPALEQALQNVPLLDNPVQFRKGLPVIDTRSKEAYRKNHLRGSYNLPDGLKFETWLGSILAPEEHFYLIAENRAELDKVLWKCAKIGYEANVEGALAGLEGVYASVDASPPSGFKENTSEYTIIDARNRDEYARGALFRQAINIPLPELRQRASEIPRGKPFVVHCAAGYRSAIAASILQSMVEEPVYDLGKAVEE